MTSVMGSSKIISSLKSAQRKERNTEEKQMMRKHQNGIADAKAHHNSERNRVLTYHDSKNDHAKPSRNAKHIP